MERFIHLLITKTAGVLEGDDPGGGTFALFLCPHPGHLDSLCVPTPGNLPIFKKNVNARSLARVGRGAGGDGHCWN